jgi:negative regulator of flagellin synthesis FlgM
MRIYGSIPFRNEAVGGATLPAGRDIRSTDKASAKQDKVELSASARDHKRVRDALGSVSDVRQDRVESLKKSVAEGTYNVSGQAVARKMLQEMRNDPTF